MAMACGSVATKEFHCHLTQKSIRKPSRRFSQCLPSLPGKNSIRNTEQFPGIEASKIARRENVLEIISTDTEMVSKMTTLRRPYEAFPFLGNRHVETIFASFFRSLPVIRYRRECLRMADGGTVALDWPIGGEDGELWRQELPGNSPVVILLVCIELSISLNSI
eukprot:Gb_02179 [translate_table: standard]